MTCKEFFEYCCKWHAENCPLQFEVFDNWNDDEFFPADWQRSQEVEIEPDDIEILEDHLYICIHKEHAAKLVKTWNAQYKQFMEKRRAGRARIESSYDLTDGELGANRLDDVGFPCYGGIDAHRMSCPKIQK